MGMCSPVVASIGAAIASADPAVNCIVSFRMLGSPISRVDAPPSLLAVSVAAGALPIPKSRMGLKPLAANQAVMNNSLTHGGFSGKTSCLEASHGQTQSCREERENRKKRQ
jgi:hypothetical protein